MLVQQLLHRNSDWLHIAGAKIRLTQQQNGVYIVRAQRQRLIQLTDGLSRTAILQMGASQFTFDDRDLRVERI